MGRRKTITKTICLSLSTALLDAIDEHSNQLYVSRSEYLRHAAIEQMKLDDSVQNQRGEQSRGATPKHLPLKFVVPSNDDEFAISSDYDL